MTNEEMKNGLSKAGIATADIEKFTSKYDAEKITEIVENASSPKEAFENLHAFYPELKVEDLQKHCDFIADQLNINQKIDPEEKIELTEEELENVSGGGWKELNYGWKMLIVGAALSVLFAGVGIAMSASAGSFAATAAAGTAGKALAFDILLGVGGGYIASPFATNIIEDID